MIVPPPDPAESAQVAAERFEAVVANPPGGREADAATLGALREAAITGMGRIVYSSNAVFLLELDAPDPADPGEPMRAVYKPRRGERPLWDFARHTLHLREVACYLFDAAAGFGLVPPTTLRDGPHGPGSVQLFIHAQAETEVDAERLERRLHDLATLDVLTNNADRKRAHLMVDARAELWAIDNALTFLPYPRQRTVLMDLGGAPLAEESAAAVTRLAGDAARLETLLATMATLLDAAEVAALRGRIEELAADPTYPILDPWDGRPWEGW